MTEFEKFCTIVNFVSDNYSKSTKCKVVDLLDSDKRLDYVLDIVFKEPDEEEFLNLIQDM